MNYVKSGWFSLSRLIKVTSTIMFACLQCSWMSEWVVDVEIFIGWCVYRLSGLLYLISGEKCWFQLSFFKLDGFLLWTKRSRCSRIAAFWFYSWGVDIRSDSRSWVKCLQSPSVIVNILIRVSINYNFFVNIITQFNLPPFGIISCLIYMSPRHDSKM